MRSAVAVAAAALAVGCTDSRLQYEPPEEVERFDNLLRVEGEICTNPADEVTFPVKVLFLIDGSASLQCTDSTLVRFDALQAVVNELLPLPNVYIGSVVFASFSRRLNFTRNATDVLDFIFAPENQNGTATDYQGSLATAVAMIEQDMISAGAAERARTRYVVVMVSDGLAMPRCLAGCEDDQTACANGIDDDGDGLRDGADPDCANIGDNVLHPDNLSPVCNTDPTLRRERAAPDDYVDMQGVCPAYNQPEQILARIEDLMALKDAYSAGDLKLHTVFLFSPEPVVAAVCTGQFAQLLGGDRDTAITLMQAMADQGQGVFRDVNVTTVQENFLEFDFASLESLYWLTEMLAVNVHARPTLKGVVPDSDTDGLSDEEEELLGTDWLDPDSDPDCGADGLCPRDVGYPGPDAGETDGDLYSDLFESRYSNSGFDPLSPFIPSAPCSDPADFDGDGLSNCEETFMGTERRLSDSDGDRIPDRIELMAGTDPLRDDAQEDPDFDGILNREEIRGNTLPLTPDLDRHRSAAVRYGLDDLGERVIPNRDTGEDELRRCYDFRVSRMELVPTPLPSDRGLNRVLIHAMQEPVQLVGSQPLTQLACVEVYYQGETMKDPPSGVVDVTQPYWDTIRFSFESQFEAVRVDCRTGGGIDRGAIENRINQCLGSKVQVGRYLYERDELIALLRRYVAGDLSMRIPTLAPDLFVDMEIFDPAVHCHRPWEIGRVQEFLNLLRTECLTCSAVTGG